VAKKHKLSKSSLHWFIKSRPYVLVPDIRRRFELETADEALPIVAPSGRAFVALPARAARFLEDLVREQRIGLEMAADLNARMVVGVFAFDILRQPVGQVQMRPSGAPEPEPPDEDGGDEAEPTAPRAGSAPPPGPSPRFQGPPGPRPFRRPPPGRPFDRGPGDRGPRAPGARDGGPPDRGGRDRGPRPPR
jgi:hypothetical protein